jgi:hypothetical protein
VAAVAPVTRIELNLNDDNEPPMVVSFNVGAGEQDGRYFRALAFKPVRNGTYDLVVRAYVADPIGPASNRLVATTSCPGVNVTF